MKNILNWLLLLIPIAIGLELAEADPLYIFIASAVAIIPLAGWMGRSTEWIAEHLGPGIGGLLNATFGNAAELIIAVMALRAGLHDVVKASITGSIIGNILLVLGLAVVFGGAKFPQLRFNRTAASLSNDRWIGEWFSLKSDPPRPLRAISPQALLSRGTAASGDRRTSCAW